MINFVTHTAPEPPVWGQRGRVLIHIDKKRIIALILDG